MSLLDSVRNSKMLRRPLLAVSRLLLRPLEAGPAVLRRAAYDAMPVSYFVTGGPEQFVVSTSDKVIGRELFLHGEFDFSKLQVALTILAREGQAKPSHLIDVGANIGSITIPALARGLMQSATAIEPHPENLRLLHTNLALNGVADRVCVLAQAVGAESEAGLFLKESSTNSGNHSISSHGIPVKSSRLDDVELPRVEALLWMDIEGYEGHALKGASDLLSTGMPVVCEYNPVFLIKSGGMLLFQGALADRRIFDLRKGAQPETTLDAISSSFTADSCYTDILAISRNVEG